MPTEPCRRVRAPLPGPPVYVWVPTSRPRFRKPNRKSLSPAVERLLRRNPHLKVKR